MSDKNLNGVVYLSNEDYEQLLENKTLTINGTTIYYDENTLYITPEVVASSSQDGLMSAQDKSNLDEVTTTVTTIGSKLESLTSLHEGDIIVARNQDSIKGSSVNINDVAQKSDIPTKTSQLTNDSDFITSTDLTDSIENFKADEVEPGLNKRIGYLATAILNTTTVEGLYNTIVNTFGSAVPCICNTGAQKSLYGFIQIMKQGTNYSVRFTDFTNLKQYSQVVAGTTTVINFFNTYTNINTTYLQTSDDDINIHGNNSINMTTGTSTTAGSVNINALETTIGNDNQRIIIDDDVYFDLPGRGINYLSLYDYVTPTTTIPDTWFDGAQLNKSDVQSYIIGHNKLTYESENNYNLEVTLYLDNIIVLKGQNVAVYSDGSGVYVDTITFTFIQDSEDTTLYNLSIEELGEEYLTNNTPTKFPYGTNGTYSWDEVVSWIEKHAHILDHWGYGMSVNVSKFNDDVIELKGYDFEYDGGISNNWILYGYVYYKFVRSSEDTSLCTLTITQYEL